MANRCDDNSVLPRRYKRMISLAFDLDDKQHRVMRKLFISAHAHAMKVRRDKMSQKINVDLSTEDSEPVSV